MTQLMMVRGKTAEFLLELTFEGEPVVVDPEVELVFTAKRAFSDSNADAIIHKTIDAGITVGTEPGEATVKIEPADTVDLDRRVLLWDVELVDPDENRYVVAGGTLHVDPVVSATVLGS